MIYPGFGYVGSRFVKDRSADGGPETLIRRLRKFVGCTAQLALAYRYGQTSYFFLEKISPMWLTMFWLTAASSAAAAA